MIGQPFFLTINTPLRRVQVRNAAKRYVRHALVPHHLIPSSYSAPEYNDEPNSPSIEMPAGLAAKLDILAADPYFSPLVADDLSDLPRAFIIACEYDVLRDDGILYGRRLSAEGIEVETRVEKGAWHGIAFKHELDVMKRGNQISADMLKFIKENV